MIAVKLQIHFSSHPKFVDLVRIGDDFFEIDDVLVSQSRQDLHLSQRSLTIGLQKQFVKHLAALPHAFSAFHYVLEMLMWVFH